MERLLLPPSGKVLLTYEEGTSPRSIAREMGHAVCPVLASAVEPTIDGCALAAGLRPWLDARMAHEECAAQLINTGFPLEAQTLGDRARYQGCTELMAAQDGATTHEATVDPLMRNRAQED